MRTEHKFFDKEFPALWHLVGCHLHEDWLEDVSTSAEAFEGTLEPSDELWRRAIDRYISQSSAASIQMVAAELSSILAQPASEIELEELLVVGLRSSYSPSRGNVRAWLQAVCEHLQRSAGSAT